MARESIAPRRSLRAENISLSHLGTILSHLGTKFGNEISEFPKFQNIFTSYPVAAAVAGGGVVNDYLCAKKGYPIGYTAATPAAALAVPFPNAPAGVSSSLNDFDAYSVRSWLSFFDGSTKIIDTSIFGQITVVITITNRLLLC